MNTTNTDANVIAVKAQIKALQKSIRKPKAQKKKWYFPSGVWIMIKEYMGVRNSKFMNKFLKPFSPEEKSLSIKIKNVLKLCEEYPRLFRIVEAYESCKYDNITGCDMFESLCESFEISGKSMRGMDDLRMVMKCVPKLHDEYMMEWNSKTRQNDLKVSFLQTIKDKYVDRDMWSGEEQARSRIIDEAWDDVV